MEVVDPRNIKLLTNLEMLQLLSSKLESKKKVRSQQTLLYTSSKYLKSKTPCSVQTSDAIHHFAEAAKPFKLSKLELLMLVNHCPSTQVELSVMITDMDSRFTTDEIDRMLELVGTHFPDGVAASQAINSSGVPQDAEDS